MKSILYLVIFLFLFSGCANKNIRQAAQSGDIENLKKLIVNNDDPLKLNFAFRNAVFGNQVESMGVLLEAGADINWSLGRYNNLMWATQKGHYQAAEFLIENGIDLHWRSDNKQTAYGHAVNSKNYKIANLIKGVKSIEPLRSAEHENLDDQTRWKIERDENTKLVIDHFIDNIWNKPINDIFKIDTKDPKGYKRAKHTKALKKPFTYGSIPEKIKDCHLGNEHPNISSYIHASGYGKNSAELTLEGHIGFHHPNRVMDPVTKSYNCREQDLNTLENTITGGLFYSSYSKAQDEYLANFYMTANGISEIRRMLIERNVPLQWCYIINTPKKYNGYRTKLGCFVDWWTVNIKGIIFEINPSFEVVMEENMLVSFKLNRLTIKKSQQHLTLSQIYSKKIQDKPYWEMVKGFSELGLHRAKHFIREERQKATAQAASNKAYHQAIKNKFDRMENANSIPSKSTTPDFVNKPVLNPIVKSNSSVKKSTFNATNKSSKQNSNLKKPKPLEELCYPIFDIFDDGNNNEAQKKKIVERYNRDYAALSPKCKAEHDRSKANAGKPGAGTIK